ncbi:MAG TPA: 50S ribosomal protein L11 methyltransferase [Saprospiraceae bacterium]|nr:50S ribosomal protein L11 methyltransferase [Saprospiraceae bacterium]HMP23310.1 50S ribosomal protein L11 methyltransferase [Saprospiraceae bacterium]
MMNHYRYRFFLQPKYFELLLAMLYELPFEAYEENAEWLDAYLPENQYDETIAHTLEQLQEHLPFRYEREEIAYRNWNTEWEANFRPVQVENFCGVRADFHPPMPEVRHELIINPKMAFGTGHHETTWMMLKMMQTLPLAGAKVLDYGCGTGILAILAARLGASIIDAVDIEAEAYHNTLENSQINNVDNIQVLHGTLDNVLDSGYNIILANINRNVILDSMAALHTKLLRNGVLLISGILQTDIPIIVQHADNFRFTIDEKLQKGNWACLKLLK